MTDDRQPVLLILNAGSSSLKFTLFSADGQRCGEPKSLGSGIIERRGDNEHLSYQRTDSQTDSRAQWPCNDEAPDGGTVLRLMSWIDLHTGWSIGAAAHRVVHGGDRKQVAARVDAALLTQMRALIPLAPLHQARCLAPIDYLAKAHPGLAQFACFDTAFHHTLDPLELLFGLPRALTEQGIRRYGFHGLSYEYIASLLPDYDQRAAEGRTIVAHLGNGASLCALNKGVSRATTMGFSTLDGVLMGTRPGHLDPGIVLYLMSERDMSVKSIEHLLYHECGLLGVSGGISSDMRELEANPAPEAKQAIALFVRTVVREIGTLTAILGGIDALVFTGGVGEHAVDIRNRILDGCQWLGLQHMNNGPNESPGRLSLPASAVSAWAIPTDENLMMARHVVRLLHGAC